MRSVLNKTLAASLAALVLSSSLAASTPASANPWHNHGYWGGAVALGVIGGLAAGAIVASQYDCVRYRPIFDRYGNYLGREPVNIC
ncbi:MAG TPA: hypothetical protein VEK35_02480 [Roseiarcus sp.]|nr:hypothetical protein [Roseiarcus sp.]